MNIIVNNKIPDSGVTSDDEAIINIIFKWFGSQSTGGDIDDNQLETELSKFKGANSGDANRCAMNVKQAIKNKSDADAIWQIVIEFVMKIVSGNFFSIFSVI